MKKILLKNYRPYMGLLIDIESVNDFNSNHIISAVNIPYNKLVVSPQNYLSKNKAYYIKCNKGIKSQKAVSKLEYYGYNVTQVIE